MNPRCGQPGCPYSAAHGLPLCEGCWALALGDTSSTTSTAAGHSPVRPESDTSTAPVDVVGLVRPDAFWYTDFEGAFHLVATEAEARDCAEREFDYARDEAREDGWPDGVEGIRWGVVLGEARIVERGMDEEASPPEWVRYALVEVGRLTGDALRGAILADLSVAPRTMYGLRHLGTTLEIGAHLRLLEWAGQVIYTGDATALWRLSTPAADVAHGRPPLPPVDPDDLPFGSDTEIVETSTMEDVRKALDTRWALLLRCRSLIGALRGVECGGSLAAGLYTLGGYHLGDVAALLVAIDLEGETADPLTGERPVLPSELPSMPISCGAKSPSGARACTLATGHTGWHNVHDHTGLVVRWAAFPGQGDVAVPHAPHIAAATHVEDAGVLDEDTWSEEADATAAAVAEGLLGPGEREP